MHSWLYCMIWLVVFMVRSDTRTMHPGIWNVTNVYLHLIQILANYDYKRLYWSEINWLPRTCAKIGDVYLCFVVTAGHWYLLWPTVHYALLFRTLNQSYGSKHSRVECFLWRYTYNLGTAGAGFHLITNFRNNVICHSFKPCIYIFLFPGGWSLPSMKLANLTSLITYTAY